LNDYDSDDTQLLKYDHMAGCRPKKEKSLMTYAAKGLLVQAVDTHGH